MSVNTSMQNERRLPEALLEVPVSGVNLRAGTLSDQVNNGEATLLIFLRHLG